VLCIAHPALAEYQLLQMLDRGMKINSVGKLVSGFLLLGLFQGIGVLRDHSLTGFM
jgi:hypothetical protein